MSPRYVLDASVAVKWFTRHEEPDRKTALLLRNMHQKGQCTLVLPESGLLEILNAVRYSGGAGEGDILEAADLLRKLHLEILSLDWSLLREAVVVAWATKITLYDALYVALAERLQCLLLTADEVLVSKVKGRPLVRSLAAFTPALD
ncbi:MAG TPA: type II toxin-antitoxin system VapC family toxin [Candidatus Polarisedimenticolaceae bacterium]|nr:type II toxin-antitoxin system VapC family toxin [Candidatus Polarisedimenticolaceae bacterium]